MFQKTQVNAAVTSEKPTTHNYKYNGGEFALGINLSKLIEVLGESSVQNVVARIPSRVAWKFLNYRTLGFWAEHILAPGGLLVLIVDDETIPGSLHTLRDNLQFVVASPIANSNESAIILRKLGNSWFANAWNRRICNTSKQFVSIADLISQLTKEGALIVDPFKDAEIRQTVINLGRSYLGFSATAKSTNDLIASLEVRS